MVLMTLEAARLGGFSWIVVAVALLASLYAGQ
jgi:hypothetical protein